MLNFGCFVALLSSDESRAKKLKFELNETKKSFL